MINNFYKTSLVYKVLGIINSERESLRNDLVAYSNDPVRYNRRFNMLIHLAQYELNILDKIKNFETDQHKDLTDNTFHHIRGEIMSIVDRDA